MPQVQTRESHNSETTDDNQIYRGFMTLNPRDNCWNNVVICDTIQQKVHLVYLKKVESFALSNRRFNRLSNDTQFLKIEVTLLEIEL